MKKQTWDKRSPKLALSILIIVLVFYAIMPIVIVIGMKIIRKIKVLMIEQTPDRIVFRTVP